MENVFYYLCDAKPRQFSIRCEVLNKDALKSKNLPHLSVAKSGYTLKDYREKIIHNILNMPENRLSMADYCYLCKMQAPLTISSIPCNRSR